MASISAERALDAVAIAISNIDGVFNITDHTACVSGMVAEHDVFVDSNSKIGTKELLDSIHEKISPSLIDDLISICTNVRYDRDTITNDGWYALSPFKCQILNVDISESDSARSETRSTVCNLCGKTIFHPHDYEVFDLDIDRYVELMDDDEEIVSWPFEQLSPYIHIIRSDFVQRSNFPVDCIQLERGSAELRFGRVRIQSAIEAWPCMTEASGYWYMREYCPACGHSLYGGSKEYYRFTDSTDCRIKIMNRNPPISVDRALSDNGPVPIRGCFESSDYDSPTGIYGLVCYSGYILLENTHLLDGLTIREIIQ